MLLWRLIWNKWGVTKRQKQISEWNELEMRFLQLPIFQSSNWYLSCQCWRQSSMKGRIELGTFSTFNNLYLSLIRSYLSHFVWDKISNIFAGERRIGYNLLTSPVVLEGSALRTVEKALKLCATLFVWTMALNKYNCRVCTVHCAPFEVFHLH